MSDIFPRRNLGLAENWGRSVEGRIGGVFKRLGGEIQTLGGLSRYSASSAEEFTRNAQRIEQALAAMPYHFSRSDYAPTPYIATSWAPIASLSIPVPEGKANVDLIAMATSVLPYPAGGAPTTQFSWPFDLSLVTSEYGPRDGGFHHGMDFAGGAASGGNPIPAAGDGVVAVSETGHPGWGNYVRLTHIVDATPMSTLYAHMMYAPSVGVGDSVTRGQTLGYVGNTGASFGNHLHFETWTSTTFGTDADPRWFMGMYGDADGAPVDPPLLRILIDGVSSIQFRGLVSETIPVTPSYRPIFGRSFVAEGESVSVVLEAISGGAVTGLATTLSVTGSFHV